MTVKHGSASRAERLNKVAKLINENLSNVAIAERMSLTRAYVANLVRELKATGRLENKRRPKPVDNFGHCGDTACFDLNVASTVTPATGSRGGGRVNWNLEHDT